MPFDLSRRAALTGALSLPFASAVAAARTEALSSTTSPAPANDTNTHFYPVGPWEKAEVAWYSPFRKFGFLTKDGHSFQICFRPHDVGVPGLYFRPGTEVFFRSYARPDKRIPIAAALAPITAPKILRIFEHVSKHYGCPIGATWQPGREDGYPKLARKTAMYLCRRLSSLPIETMARSIIWGPGLPEADLRDNISDWREAVDEGRHDRANWSRAAEDTEALYQSILRAGQTTLELKVRITTKMIQHKSLVT